ncbi:MAG: hypothetical protein LBQ02_01800 [Candidatus Nomurabacteria bacterium]|jgi:hypothetical protein|nr:hypothetical protein [Candidatus Nomurabacteria bacterium]
MERDNKNNNFGKRIENAIVDGMRDFLREHVKTFDKTGKLRPHEFRANEYDDYYKGTDVRIISLDSFPPIDLTTKPVGAKDHTKKLDYGLAFPDDDLYIDYGIRTANNVEEFDTPTLVIAVPAVEMSQNTEQQIAQKFMNHFHDILFMGAYLYNEHYQKNNKLIAFCTDAMKTTCGLPAIGKTKAVRRAIARCAGCGIDEVTYYPLVNPHIALLQRVIEDGHDVFASMINQ